MDFFERNWKAETFAEIHQNPLAFPITRLPPRAGTYVLGEWGRTKLTLCITSAPRDCRKNKRASSRLVNAIVMAFLCCLKSTI